MGWCVVLLRKRWRAGFNDYLQVHLYPIINATHSMRQDLRVFLAPATLSDTCHFPNSPWDVTLFSLTIWSLLLYHRYGDALSFIVTYDSWTQAPRQGNSGVVNPRPLGYRITYYGSWIYLLSPRRTVFRFPPWASVLLTQIDAHDSAKVASPEGEVPRIFT